MAIQRVDDLDGTTPAERVIISVNDQSWQLDLGQASMDKLLKAIKAFTDKAVPIPTPSSVPVRKQQTSKMELSLIRSWARTQGYQVSDRGRVAQEIIDAYAAQR